MLLTIGITVFDDFAGAWGTLTNLIAFERPILEQHCEIVLIDNNPGSQDGKALRFFATRQMRSWPCPVRYIPFAQPQGTAVVRNKLFAEAEGEFVLCVDPHIVLHGLIRLIKYLQDNPECVDLLTGPVVMDDGTTYRTHQLLQWSTNQYGVWDTDDRGLKYDGEPFEITQQGLGVFCCSTDAWPGFDERQRGMSCVECVLCEKFRNAGHKVLCLPFLKWHHRWAEYLGSKGPSSDYDRTRNHLMEFMGIGWNVQPVLDHFGPRLQDSDVVRLVDEMGLKVERIERRSLPPQWDVLEQKGLK